MAVSSIGSGQSLSELLENVKSNVGESATAEELNAELEKAYEEKYKQYVEQLKTGAATSKTTSQYSILAQTADDLPGSLTALEGALASGDTTQVAGKLAAFVSSYNSMISGLKSAKSAECTALVGAFTKIFQASEETLSGAGIHLSAEGKLSINTETLAEADLSGLKDLFSGRSALTGQLKKYSASVVQVASLKISGYNALQNMYSSSGAAATRAAMNKSLLDMLG